MRILLVIIALLTVVGCAFAPYAVLAQEQSKKFNSIITGDVSPKPVVCASTAQVIDEMKKLYKEIPAIRYTDPNGQEVIIYMEPMDNATIANLTILEFLPKNDTGCVISHGTNVQFSKDFWESFVAKMGKNL
jgi:hypothetical protein